MRVSLSLLSSAGSSVNSASFLSQLLPLTGYTFLGNSLFLLDHFLYL